MKRVVITGIGPVSNLGMDKSTFFQQILEHKITATPLPEHYLSRYDYITKCYIPLTQVRIRDFVPHKNYENFMEYHSKACVAGSKIALLDAGFQLVESDKGYYVKGLEACNILLGVGSSSLNSSFNSLLVHELQNYPEYFKENSVSPVFNRMVLPLTMPNSPAAWTSIVYGVQGFSYTINASCASATCAIGESFLKIKYGLAKTMITGGVEYCHDDFGCTLRSFDILNTLSTSLDGNPQPFSKNRSGFIFNDGCACILILEELESALSRGAQILCEICDYGVNSDAHSIVQLNPNGKKILELLEQLTKGRDIQYFNTHGSGTQQNDEVEGKIIQEVFGDIEKQPLLNSTKGIIGHTLGASGAFEAAVTALSIYHQKVHGNKLDDPMENLNLVKKSKEAPIDYAISCSYGFGGHNAGLLFKKFTLHP